jgi:tetratricopeptide (TPR) repeat protein
MGCTMTNMTASLKNGRRSLFGKHISRWASTFGEPERGAEMVDQVIRLNPSYLTWAATLFATAYFMVGRYDDALKMLERMPPDSYQMGIWALRGGSLASLGQTADAKKSVEEALKRHPKLTIEAMANEPGYSEAEHQTFIRTMRLAGFPPCAQPDELARVANPVRLPECTKR